MRTPRPVLLGLMLAVTVVTAACGASDQAAPPAPAPPATEAATAALNDADVAFLQGMIPHHQGAVDMAEMVPERTTRPELRRLADNIITSQNQELGTMRDWLTQAGQQVSTGGMDNMAGAMNPGEMQRLFSLRGTPFDLTFLEAMTVHHEGAISQSNAVLNQGQDPRVAQLARQIIDAQQAEIEQMRGWQQQWGG